MPWDKLLPILALLPAIGAWLDSVHWVEEEDRQGIREWFAEVRDWLASDRARPSIAHWWESLAEMVGRGTTWTVGGLLLFWFAVWLDASATLGRELGWDHRHVMWTLKESLRNPKRLALRWYDELKKGPPRTVTLSIPLFGGVTLDTLGRPTGTASPQDVNIRVRRPETVQPWPRVVHWIGVLAFAASAGFITAGVATLAVSLASIALLPLGALLIWIVRPALAWVFGASSHPKRKPFVYLTSLASLVIAAVKSIVNLFTG